jgi:hypothetical protein
MRDHLSGEEISAYSAGWLDAELQADVEGHATECNRCLDALEDGLRRWVQWAPNQDD